MRVLQALVARSGGGWAFAVVLAAAALAHLPSLFNGFVWDDFTFIVGNPVLKDAGNIPALFANPETLGTGTSNPYYRPLTTLTFLVDTQLWGALPAGFHATNVLLHLGACALLLAVLRRLLTTGAALAAALLFAVHPAHAEPVAFVSARADQLCALLLLAAFLAWIRYGETGRRGALALSTLAYFAALLAKITAGLYPAVFALYGLLCFRRRLRVRDLAPFAAAALVFLAINNAVLDIATWPDQPLLSRVATAGPLIVRYLLIAVSPVHLGVFHDLDLRPSLDAVAIGAWAGIAALVTLAALFARRAPHATLGLAWFLAGIVPVSGIVTVLYPALAADRYLYLPLAGAALALGTGLQRVLELRPAWPHLRLVAGAAAVALLALTGFTMARGRLWRDPVTFWERAVLEAPGSLFALNALGLAYKSDRRDDEALRVLLRALELDELNPETNLNLASAAFQRRDFESAMWHTFRALYLAPESPRAYSYIRRLMHQAENGVGVRAAEQAFELGLLDAETLEMLSGRPRANPGAAVLE